MSSVSKECFRAWTTSDAHHGRSGFISGSDGRHTQKCFFGLKNTHHSRSESNPWSNAHNTNMLLVKLLRVTHQLCVCAHRTMRRTITPETRVRYKNSLLPSLWINHPPPSSTRARPVQKQFLRSSVQTPINFSRVVQKQSSNVNFLAAFYMIALHPSSKQERQKKNL